MTSFQLENRELENVKSETMKKRNEMSNLTSSKRKEALKQINDT